MSKQLRYKLQDICYNATGYLEYESDSAYYIANKMNKGIRQSFYKIKAIVYEKLQWCIDKVFIALFVNLKGV